MASTTHGGGFARAAETEPGYKRSEVDRLFTRLAEDYEKLSGAAELPEDLYTSRRIRQVVFREEPGGYQLDVVDRVYAQLNSEEPLDPSVVRHAKFRPASGTVSYEESQVDAFLDRCIELLQDLL